MAMLKGPSVKQIKSKLKNYPLEELQRQRPALVECIDERWVLIVGHHGNWRPGAPGCQLCECNKGCCLCLLNPFSIKDECCDLYYQWAAATTRKYTAAVLMTEFLRRVLIAVDELIEEKS